jgi:hypothetical protein
MIQSIAKLTGAITTTKMEAMAIRTQYMINVTGGLEKVHHFLSPSLIHLCGGRVIPLQ